MSAAPLAVVPPAPPDALLTPDQVAQRLAVSRSMVYALIRRGDLRALYIGRLPRVTEADFAAYLARAAEASRS